MGRTIAIVEDEPAIRANYAEALRRQGYEVAAYTNRREAMAGMQTRLPDLALIDIGLDDEIDGGFTLCRDLRARSETLAGCERPFFALAARSSTLTREDQREAVDPSEGHRRTRVRSLRRR